MEYPRIKTCIDTSVDDFISELYTPCFKWAERLDRGVGYFTSGWLEYNISGLSDFASRGGKIRLITSPILSNIDSDAIIASENPSEDFEKFENALNNSVTALEKEMKADILNAFSWMLYDGIIELKFAVPCEKLSDGNFHDKFGIFYKGHEAISFSGSINDSKHGFANYESLKVFKTWAGTGEYVESDIMRFERLWHGQDKNLKIYNIPTAIKDRIFTLRNSDRPYAHKSAPSNKWEHQDKAVECFLEKEHGILAMATGTGKTITAIKIMTKLFEESRIKRVVITMYGNDLLDQWTKQMRERFSDSDSALSNLRTRRDEVEHTIRTLKFKADNYKKRIEEYEVEKAEKIAQRNEIDKKYKDLNQEKNNIIKEIEKNKKDISAKIAEIMRLTKSPYLISQSLCDRMHELGASMTKLKLPKNTSKDFFTELAHSEKCVCDRCIGETEREAILRNAERYLGSNQQSVLNTIKSSISGCEYDSSLNDAFEQLSELQEQATILNNRFNDNEEKLIKAGGDKAAELQSRIEELTENIGACKKSLNVIEAKSDPYETLTKDNNLCLANEALDELEKKIAAATNTNRALRRKEIVEELLNRIKQETTKSLKAEIVRKTNEKLKSVITDDKIEIESIDKYIKLKDRAGASEGQTLGIAYCFLGTLFEDAELQFPFIIDSPTGKMDFAKRQAVADIIPNVFNQMIAFVQSAEVERFADRFYNNPDSQYITIIASPDDENVEVKYGKDYFDSYQREHKGDEE